MGNRLSDPNIQFFDNSGLPLSGGVLSFFLSSTTTPAAVYTNASLSIAAGTAITLDSAGRAGDIFLDSAVTYKVILANAAGTPLWTRDPVVDVAANTTAALRVSSGNPNGSYAGNAGTVGGQSASQIFDIVNNILYVATTTGSASTAVWTAVSNTFTGTESVKTNDYTVVLTDAGNIITANKASAITFSLTAAATIGASKLFGFKNIGAGTLTIDPNGSETIEGATTFSVTTNQGVIAYCTGSAWRVLASYSVASSAGDLQAYSADAGAGAGPNVVLYRDSASPAASDLIGDVVYQGRDSGAAVQTYADIVGRILDPTAASEDAALAFRAMVAGALTEIMTVGPGVQLNAGSLSLAAGSTGLSIASSGAGLQIGSPTGGDKGAGTLNLSGGIYVNGVVMSNWLLASKVIPNANVLTTGASPYTLFTVTGDVLVRVFATVQTLLVSTANTGTLKVGVTGQTDFILSVNTVNGTNFPTGSAWGYGEAALAPQYKASGLTIYSVNQTTYVPEVLIASSANIILTIATNSLTAGAITFYCQWQGLSSGASVVAA